MKDLECDEYSDKYDRMCYWKLLEIWNVWGMIQEMNEKHELIWQRSPILYQCEKCKKVYIK
jgi:hypothetical protein